MASNLNVLATVQYGASVLVLINQGGGNFAPPANYSIEPGAEAITAADLDLDGNIDLAVANTGDVTVLDDGNISLLFNRGDGTFGQDVVLQAGVGPCGIIVRNLDGQGAPDIAAVNRASNTVSIFFNE